MSMFGQLKNSVCAAALLTGVFAFSLTASDEFPEEPKDCEKLESRLQVEAAAPAEDEEETFRRLARIISAPLTASDEFPEEPKDCEKLESRLQVEAAAYEEDEVEEFQRYYTQNEERWDEESESEWKFRRKFQAGVLRDVIAQKELRRIVESLPDEVVAHILSFTGLGDWGDIRLTCSRFRDISRFVFKDLEGFKSGFDIITDALREKRSENPDNLLEHYADALNTMRRQYAQFLGHRTREEKLTLGRMIYSRSQHAKLPLYRNNKGKTPYEDALFSVWPPLAATMVILGGNHHFSYEKGSYKKGSYRTDYFVYDPEKVTYLGASNADPQSRDVFALIGDSYNLQSTFVFSKDIERQALFASELMHRGAAHRTEILKKADAHIDNKDYDAAFNLLQLVVSRYLDAPEIEANDVATLALLYQAKSRQEHNEQYEKSYKFYLKKAVEKDKEVFLPHIYLSAAEFYSEDEQWDQAMENYKIAIAKNPEFEASVYKKAGITFIDGKQFDEAFHYLIEAKSLDLELTPEIDAYLGLANFKLNREDRAREYAEKALKAGAVQIISQKELKRFIKLFKLVEGYEAYLAPSGQ